MQAEAVSEYFDRQADYWRDIYVRREVLAETYRRRQAAALSLIDGLNLSAGAGALEVGCGAGFCTIALARRGFTVTAVDSAEAMVEVARRQVASADVAAKVEVRLGDARSPPFADGSFQLVVALGLLAWIDRPLPALREMARVTRPGGHLVVTAANRSALHNLIDPTLNPALQPLKRWLRRTAFAAGLDLGPRATLHSRGAIDRALQQAGLTKVRSLTLGFGPFTVFRLPLMPRFAGLRAFGTLQRLADRGVPVVRSAGRTYLVLARKEDDHARGKQRTP